mgnify:CR=1 FL=1
MFSYVVPDRNIQGLGTLTISIDHAIFDGSLLLDWDLSCYPLGDFNHDGKVDLADVVALGYWWLDADPRFDIAPPPDGDGVVNLKDFALLAEQWLIEIDGE